ncbi:TPA: hypothetical protein ACPVZ6_001626 [Vibrio parahaemolyticus]|uniref:hypothetical protein n=2 Tax=Vibrio parahaemolyticus TaxID=670 RepID=UPI000411B63D|nr:hypothetical protein [Vibrio parahaemolyticus]MBE3763133.1 hypothetical protein [Vibrio parahaemolyticus]
MSANPQKQPALYSDAMDEALVEYVKQDIAGFAHRYYDTGKFLFSVSSFSILATLTIKTTFGSNYDIVLSALIFFIFCLFPSYKLTVGIDHTTIPTKTILKEYQDKKEWMNKHLERWFISFILGCLTLAFAFVFVMLNSKDDETKSETILNEINRNLVGIESELRRGNQRNITSQSTCSFDDIRQVKILLSDLDTLIDEQRAENKALFSEVDIHLDRHLDLMANKISKVCSD